MEKDHNNQDFSFFVFHHNITWITIITVMNAFGIVQLCRISIANIHRLCTHGGAGRPARSCQHAAPGCQSGAAGGGLGLSVAPPGLRPWKLHHVREAYPRFAFTDKKVNKMEARRRVTWLLCAHSFRFVENKRTQPGYFIKYKYSVSY